MRDWLPTASKSSGWIPGAALSACSMSVMGADPLVPAVTSNPPPNSSRSAAAFRNELVDAEPVTSVKTTSVNIARVAPVRNLLVSG